MESLKREIDHRNRQQHKAYLKKIAIEKKIVENLADSLKRAGVDLEGVTSELGNKMKRDFEKLAAKRLKAWRSE